MAKEDYLRKQEVLKLWGQIVDLFATKSSVTTLQGYFTDGKAKKAIADGDGNTISTSYLKLTGGVMNNNVGIGWKNSGGTQVANLLSYNSGNNFVIGYSQKTTGDTRIFGKDIRLYSNGETERLTVDSTGKVTIGELDTPALGVLASGIGSVNAIAQDNKQAIDAHTENITELYGYFNGGVANNAARLTTVSKTAWGKTFWTANGVPDSISGDMTGVGDVKMDNDKGIYIKDYSASTYREVLKLDYTDLLSLGYETGAEGYDTYIWGSQVVLSAHDGNDYQDIATAKVVSGVNKFDISGDLTITKGGYTSNGLSLDASGNMKISEGARLTDIYGSTIKFYIGTNEAASIDSSKNLTSKGSVIGLMGVAAYGIADLSLITDNN